MRWEESVTHLFLTNGMMGKTRARRARLTMNFLFYATLILANETPNYQLVVFTSKYVSLALQIALRWPLSSHFAPKLGKMLQDTPHPQQRKTSSYCSETS
jgi:hypothetical protein